MFELCVWFGLPNTHDDLGCRFVFRTGLSLLKLCILHTYTNWNSCTHTQIRTKLHCNAWNTLHTLKHWRVYCNTRNTRNTLRPVTHCDALQHTTKHCNTLHCTAKTLQHTATKRNTSWQFSIRCVRVCCSSEHTWVSTMYMCVCVYVSVCVRVCVCVCACVCVQYVCLQPLCSVEHMHTNSFTYAQTHTRTHKHTQTRAQTHTRTHIDVYSLVSPKLPWGLVQITN